MLYIYIYDINSLRVNEANFKQCGIMRYIVDDEGISLLVLTECTEYLLS